MKSQMPSLGVRVPEVRSIVRAAATDRLPGRLQELQSTVLELWRGAGYREERYAAIELTGLKLAAGELGMLAALRGNHPHRSLVGPGGRGGSHRLCALLQAHREDMTPVLDAGARTRTSGSGGPRSRRSWGRRSATDTALLAAVIEANLADREFFIRKAIGWALRDYAATDPDWVRKRSCGGTAGRSARSPAGKRSGTAA